MFKNPSVCLAAFGKYFGEKNEVFIGGLVILPSSVLSKWSQGTTSFASVCPLYSLSSWRGEATSLVKVLKNSQNVFIETERPLVLNSDWGVSVVTVINLCAGLSSPHWDFNHYLLIQAIVLLIPDTYTDSFGKPWCSLWVQVCVNCFCWMCG